MKTESLTIKISMTETEVFQKLVECLRPLTVIAEAYDDNELDDDARKFWGQNNEHTNTVDPDQIELYTGRGGKCLLTLADCLKVRDLIKEAETKCQEPR